MQWCVWRAFCALLLGVELAGAGLSFIRASAGPIEELSAQLSSSWADICNLCDDRRNRIQALDQELKAAKDRITECVDCPSDSQSTRIKAYGRVSKRVRLERPKLVHELAIFQMRADFLYQVRMAISPRAFPTQREIHQALVSVESELLVRVQKEWGVDPDGIRTPEAMQLFLEGMSDEGREWMAELVLIRKWRELVPDQTPRVSFQDWLLLIRAVSQEMARQQREAAGHPLTR